MIIVIRYTIKELFQSLYLVDNKYFIRKIRNIFIHIRDNKYHYSYKR